MQLDGLWVLWIYRNSHCHALLAPSLLLQTKKESCDFVVKRQEELIGLKSNQGIITCCDDSFKDSGYKRLKKHLAVFWGTTDHHTSDHQLYMYEETINTSSDNVGK